MTGDLRLPAKFRDIQVAEDVGKKAELGYFDVEFTMYGCAYLNPKDGRMYYKISPQAVDIYDFIETGARQDIFPGGVEHLTVTCLVPLGMREVIARDVKKQLARKLRELYPVEFFHELYQMADDCTRNDAALPLQAEAEAISGIFEEERIRRFEMLVHYMYSCRQLERSAYEALLAWIAEERRSMEDDSVSKDQFEKTVYGFGYMENGVLKYISNAQRDAVYQKAWALEQKGVPVLPVYHKTYWYNYSYRLADVVKDFKSELKRECSIEYYQKIEGLRGKADVTRSIETWRKIKEIQNRYGEAAAQTARRYAYRWGIYYEEPSLR